MKKISKEVQDNRDFFLAELRSGNYKKGTIISDEITGNPIFPDGNCEGSCACAVMHDLFFEYKGTKSSRNYLKALGLTTKECRFIQQKLNDTELNFNQIADAIEKQIFKR